MPALKLSDILGRKWKIAGDGSQTPDGGPVIVTEDGEEVIRFKPERGYLPPVFAEDEHLDLFWQALVEAHNALFERSTMEPSSTESP